MASHRKNDDTGSNKAQSSGRPDRNQQGPTAGSQDTFGNEQSGRHTGGEQTGMNAGNESAVDTWQKGDRESSAGNRQDGDRNYDRTGQRMQEQQEADRQADLGNTQSGDQPDQGSHAREGMGDARQSDGGGSKNRN
jgi:hypothetical protein